MVRRSFLAPHLSRLRGAVIAGDPHSAGRSGSSTSSSCTREAGNGPPAPWHRTVLIPLLILAGLLAPPELSGQVTPIAGPFEVSPRNYSLDDPSDHAQYVTFPPSLAALSDDSFVVAWNEDIWIQEDEESRYNFDLYVRQIGAEGRPGSFALVFRGNIEGDFFPGTPELAGDGLGGFTFVWDVLPSYSSEIHFATVDQGRFYQPSVEGLVSQGTGREGVVSPAVAVHATGAWAAAWERWLDSDGDGNSDKDRRHIELRAFHASGEPSSPAIRIQPADPNVVLSGPRVAILADRFLVIWAAFGGPRPPVLQGRLFALDGTSLTPVFQIARLPAFQIDPPLGAWDVVTDGNAGFWIVSKGRLSQRGPARITHYSPQGVRLETAMLGTGSLGWRVHMNRRGEISFVWIEPDGRVLLQVLDRRLVPRGKRQWVTRAGDRPWEWSGDVAVGDTGRVLVVWTGNHEVTTPNGDKLQPLIGKLWQIEE